MNELLQQVRVLDPATGTDRTADVWLEAGVIKAVEDRITEWPAETQVRDCRGLILGPGLVDLYSHSGEPGFEERETLDSLAQTAAAGGFTRVTLLPDTHPPGDNAAGLAFLHAKVSRLSSLISSVPQLQFWGALTLEVKGQQMSELGELAHAGIVGFADGLPLSNLPLVRRLLEYLKPLNQPVALWPCDRQLSGKGVAREGSQSIRLGLPGNPALAETSALSALLEVVETVGTPVHLMRVSCARSVELIRGAKARGVPVTASTPWMHLLLNTEALAGNSSLDPALQWIVPYDPTLRLEPPLGNPADQQALLQGVKDGTLDVIAVDHSPYTYEEKTVAFGDAPPGAIGLELALPLLWQHLVIPGTWSALELWQALSSRPATCLRQTPAQVTPGRPVELTLFDPEHPWIVDESTLKSKSVNTPWFRQKLTGRVLQIWRAGVQ